ncbi:MAG: hypothetical protein J5563_00475 [Clostridia bacterium]|nr:hypothetical protein [Clostridia bacterium]
MVCRNCGGMLLEDEISVNIKLIGRGEDGYFCIDCLSGVLKCHRKNIEDLIDRFRKAGCPMFPER